MMRDTERARRIVRLAATRVKDPFTRSWLLADAREIFVQLTEEYLDKTSVKAAQLKMCAEKVDDEIATVISLIGLRALTGQLEHQKERKRR